MATRVRIADPAWINRGTSAREARLGFEGLITSARSYGRGGLLAADNPVGPTSPASMTSRVTPCFVAIPKAGQGMWIAAVEAAALLAHPDPSSSGQRVDLVVARVYDGEAGDTIPADVIPPVQQPGNVVQSGVAVVELVVGTVGAGAPAVPSGSVLLRTVIVPAGASATLSSLAYQGEGPIATARGGITPLHSAVEQDGLNSYEGQTVVRRDTGKMETRWNGRWGAIASLNGRVLWAPVLRGSGVPADLGQGGYASGRAQVVNKEMDVAFSFRFGSTGVDGKTGTLTCDLPPGVTSAGQAQELQGSVYCPNQGVQYAVKMQVAAGATFGVLAATTAFNDCAFRAMRNTDPANPTFAGTGVPRIDAAAGAPGGDYVLQNNGNITISGRLEIV